MHAEDIVQASKTYHEENIFSIFGVIQSILLNHYHMVQSNAEIVEISKDNIINLI